MRPRLRDALEPSTDGYITGEAFSDTGSTYANATAKLLAFVQESGGDPTSYDGKNLVTRLEAQVGDGSGDVADGALFDTSIYGNNTNTLGQGFAAQGLSEVGSTKADSVTDYLLAQQCDDGHFPLKFRTDASDSCTSAASVDVTALVAVALRNQSDDPAVSKAVVAAGDFIAGQQNANGSVGGAPPTTDPNANTTGLAAWALGESCDLDNALDAATWTRDLQVGSDQAGTPLAAETGAIAYDRATLERDTADGISDTERDQYRRATAQAANGLAYDLSAEPTVTLEGPDAKFVQSGSDVRLTVTGISEGDAPCVSGRGARVLLGDDSTTADAVVTIPPKASGAIGYVATTGPGLSVSILRALPSKNFKVSVKRAKVPASKKQKVTVRGLAKGESVTVRYQGRVVDRAIAKKKRYTTRFDVVRTKGKQKVQVFGEFGNRKGAKKFRVVKG